MFQIEVMPLVWDDIADRGGYRTSFQSGSDQVKSGVQGGDG